MSPIIGVIDSAKTNWLSTTNFDSIASATAAGGAGTSITFNSIPQTYSHLRLHILCATYDGNVRGLQIGCNNDTSSSYSAHAYFQTNGAMIENNATSLQYATFFAGSYGMHGLANYWSPLIVDIYDYANTSKNKTMMAYGGNTGNGQWNNDRFGTGMTGRRRSRG